MSRKQTKSSTETPSELAASISSESLTFIRDEIRGLANGKKKSKGHDAASRIAWLAKNASQVAAEQRKAEKGESDAIKKLSPAVLLAWAKEQTPELRARFVRDIAAIDSKDRKSVLG
ncbi:MAG TPA: hypothetical protein VGM39_08655 [Kofleriaceae bacterium]|jgi:hypothetical protein